MADPHTGRPVYDTWTKGGTEDAEIGRLGSGSDYTAFLDHLGVPSMEAGFTNDASGGTTTRPTTTRTNMERYLDPGYLGHAGSSRVTGVTALRLANADVLPFHYSDYAAAVTPTWRSCRRSSARREGAAQVDLAAAARGGRRTGAHGGDRARGARRRAAGVGRPRHARAARRRAHQPVADAPGAGARRTPQGLPGRPWFRHQIYAPGLVTGYAAQFLPGLRDAVEQGDAATAQRYRDLLLDSLRAAARLARQGAGTTS